MKLFTIYDEVAKEYAAPFMCKNEEVAKRQFLLAMKQSRVENVSEYTLLYLADYDIETGKIEPLAVPDVINYGDVE